MKKSVHDLKYKYFDFLFVVTKLLIANSFHRKLLMGLLGSWTGHSHIINYQVQRHVIVANW